MKRRKEGREKGYEGKERGGKGEKGGEGEEGEWKQGGTSRDVLGEGKTGIEEKKDEKEVGGG